MATPRGLPRMLLGTLLLAAAGAAAGDPSPPVWPERFAAVMFQNRTGHLALTTLWYDWPGGMNLNFIQQQTGRIVWDMEWTNGTSFYVDLKAGTCKTVAFPVGILPPDWLANASYLGEETVDAVRCHKWAKADFVTYWADAASGDPIRWRFFTGAQFEVLSFAPGARLPAPGWQAPPICFQQGPGAAGQPGPAQAGRPRAGQSALADAAAALAAAAAALPRPAAAA